MKKLNEFINDRYVSLEGLNEEEIEKLSNLDGSIIHECCSDCECDCGCDCCCPAENPTISAELPSSTCTTIAKPIEVDMAYKAIERFRNIAYCPKVQDLYTLSSALTPKGRFMEYTTDSYKEPIYIVNYGNISKSFEFSKKLNEFVKEVSSTLELSYPVVYNDSNADELKVFFIKHTGTNGKEGSIKNSLSEMVKVLNKLEGYKEITWAQVLDVSIDALDDLYSFLLVVTLDTSSYEEELKNSTEFPQPIQKHK